MSLTPKIAVREYAVQRGVPWVVFLGCAAALVAFTIYRTRSHTHEIDPCAHECAPIVIQETPMPKRGVVR